MMNQQTKTVTISQADFKTVDTIESLEAELVYLRDRVKYYKETVSLDQIESLLNSVSELSGELLNDDQVREKIDEARSEAREEGRDDEREKNENETVWRLHIDDVNSQANDWLNRKLSASEMKLFKKEFNFDDWAEYVDSKLRHLFKA